MTLADRRPLIAVVDDDSGFAGYLRTFLGVRGYDARAYTRGEEIVAAIRQGQPPDVVLLDVAMPGMDGLQTLKALKASRPELQVIMLSGREMAPVIVEAVRTGRRSHGAGRGRLRRVVQGRTQVSRVPECGGAGGCRGSEVAVTSG